MRQLARWLAKPANAWGVIVVVTLLAAWSALRATGVESDDDLLAFLPQNNPDVDAFRQVNRMFGSLDLALVGIETEDAYDAAFLERLQRTTRQLKETHGINHVLSLANVVDFAPDPERGGVVTTPLLYEIPRTPEQKRAFRNKVSAMPEVLGRLVSADGKAVLLYCFLTYGADPLQMAERIGNVVDENFPNDEKFWGGGPFVSAYIYDATKRDIRRLTPWAVALVVVLLLLTFRDPIGVLVVLVSAGIGTLFSMAVMGVLGERFNIVLGSMPIILFAVGSAYGIHVLARYYVLRQKHPPAEALGKCVAEAGPVVLAAALTTAAGLLSFLTMDIAPLRSFGLFTSVGILATMALSVTFVPAVLCVSRFSRKPVSLGPIASACQWLAEQPRRHRLATSLVVGLVAAVSAGFVSQVRTSMDNASFYDPDSPPGRSERFLRGHFGGSLFVQVHLQADFTRPELLKQLQLLADRVMEFEGVSDALTLSEVIAKANQAFVGQKRIPDMPEQVALLHQMLAADPSVEQLVSRDRKQALVHFKLEPLDAESVETVLEKIEKTTERIIPDSVIIAGISEQPEKVKAQLEKQLDARLRVFERRHGLERGALGKAKFLRKDSVPIDKAYIERKLAAWLASDECAVDLDAIDPDLPARLARAIVDTEAWKNEKVLRRAIEKAFEAADEQTAEDVLWSVQGVLYQFADESRAAGWARGVLRAAGIETGKDRVDMLLGDLAMAWLEAAAGSAAIPAERNSTGAIEVMARVTGLPVMHRGLSASTRANQIRSLVSALLSVLVVMAVFFRSIWSALLVSVPTMFTLLVIYGFMGLASVKLDIGTAMLACLVLGAGVDYAVHLASAWRCENGDLVEAARRAAGETGPAIWINAVCVAAGFLVLATGEARPVRNVGTLTAAAMMVAATATFVLLPLLARKKRYRPVPDENPAGEIECTAAVASGENERL